MQKGGEVERCFPKNGIINELEPVQKPSGVKRSPVHQVIEVTVVSGEWCTRSKTDGRVMKCVQFFEGAL